MRGCRSQSSLLGPPSKIRGVVRSRRALRVENAISREKKEAIVENVRTRLKDSALVFGMSTKGLTVAQMEELRQALPSEHTSVYVCKNSLLKIAADEVDGWSSLHSAAKNQNAWVFVGEDGIATTVKNWLDFQKTQTRILKDNAEGDAEVDDATQIHGGTFNGTFCTPEEIAKLKDLPTKSESLASLLGILNSIPASLMASLQGVPMQLALNVDRMAELDDEKTRLVKEFVKASVPSEEATS